MYTYIIYDNCILHLMFQCLKTIFNISCRPQEYIKSMLIQQPSPTPKDIPALPGRVTSWARRRCSAPRRSWCGWRHSPTCGDSSWNIWGDLTGAIINIYIDTIYIIGSPPHIYIYILCNYSIYNMLSGSPPYVYICIYYIYTILSGHPHIHTYIYFKPHNASTQLSQQQQPAFFKNYPFWQNYPFTTSSERSNCSPSSQFLTEFPIHYR